MRKHQVSYLGSLEEILIAKKSIEILPEEIIYPEKIKLVVTVKSDLIRITPATEYIIEEIKIPDKSTEIIISDDMNINFFIYKNTKYLIRKNHLAKEEIEKYI